jgi:multiple sugar transport system permease protein
MNPPDRWAPGPDLDGGRRGPEGPKGLVAPGGWRHLPAVLVAATFVFPLWFMLSGSLREAGLPPPRTPELVPWPLAFGNYERAIELVDLPRYALNSLMVVGLAVPLTVLFASWAGFAMSQLPKRTAGVMVGVSLVALMVPVTALLVSRFALFRLLHLTDTFVPLVAPSLMGTSPFYVLLFYWSFKRVPGELFEASRLAGYGSLRTWWRVAMPLVRPVTVAVAVLAFVFTWSNFIDPLIYLFDERKFTLPLGLRSLAQLDPQNFPLLLAGSVMATAPVVAAFLYVQRHFLQRHRGVGWLGR